MNITPITIDVMSLKEPNRIGEALRAWAFPGPGCGCYSNFDVRPDFVPISPEEPENRWIVAGMLGRNDDDEVSAEYMAGATAYRAPNGLVVAWYWEGDGLLAFLMRDQWALTNSDCKKDYEWTIDLLVPGLVSYRDFGHMSAHETLAAISHPEFQDVNRINLAVHLLSRLDKFRSIRADAYEVASEIPAALLVGNNDVLRSRTQGLQTQIAKVVRKYPNARDIPHLRSALHILEGAFVAHG